MLEENLLGSRNWSRKCPIRKFRRIPAGWRPRAREHGSLTKLVTKYRRFKSLCAEIGELTAMQQSEDPEEREMAEAELPDLRARREKTWDELLEPTIGGEDANRCVVSWKSELARAVKSSPVRSRLVRNVPQVRGRQRLASRDHGC